MMMAGKRTRLLAAWPCMALAAITIAACSEPEDPAERCAPACETCCEQSETCGLAEYDACWEQCRQDCAHEAVLHGGGICFDALVNRLDCVCGLACAEREAWNSGASAACAAEAAEESESCMWE